MRAYVSSIINEEIERTRGRLGDDTADEVARSLHRVSNALLHTPSVRAQELARTGDIDDYRRAMHTLFGIDFDTTAAK
jgi:glutamyl-tRNA reductase